jgi:hypothetical protein
MAPRPAPVADASAPSGRAAPRTRRALLAWLLAVYGAATVAYILLPSGLTENAATMGLPLPSMPLWQLALANLALVMVAYGAFAFAGDWLAGRAGIPGALRSGGSAAELWWRPMALGLGAGAALVIVDRVTAALSAFPGFPHPPFPSSLLASLTAGIGEEIAFRLLVLSLWAALLTWLVRRLRRPGLLPAALWTANVLAALAFAAGHLGSAVALAGVHSPADLPVAELVELTLLNGGLGLLAGRLFLRHGLPAAIGVHFWADIVWHVLFPALA